MVDLLTVSKERKESIERLAREFRAGRSVAISTHINADGDGCGSETALARILAQKGLTAKIVNPTPWPDTYEFLLGKFAGIKRELILSGNARRLYNL